MRAFSGEAAPNFFSRAARRGYESSIQGYCTSRKNVSCAMVFSLPVEPGFPDTKIKSPSFTPAVDHLK